MAVSTDRQSGIFPAPSSESSEIRGLTGANLTVMMIVVCEKPMLHGVLQCLEDHQYA